MYTKVNIIEYTQLSVLEPEIRKPFTTRLRWYLIGIAIFMATSALLFCLRQYNVVIQSIVRTEDALPSAEDPNFSPKAKSIFFHETFHNGLTVRQACAVEAAATANPKKEIYVLFSKPVTEYGLKTGCLADLYKFPNVKFLRIHSAEYSKGTAVQSILLNDVVLSRYRIQHTADILRILTLNKWGGIYLDTDMIVTRSLEDLPANFIARESETDVASAILSFAKDEIGAYVTNEIIKEISKKYDPKLWSHIGAEAIERVLQAMCFAEVLSDEYRSRSRPFNCKGVTIFTYELFYPQHFTDVDDIFNPAPEEFDLNRPYTYHMYDFLTHNRSISRGTIYELVAKAFCPSIYSTYPDEFSAKAIKVT